MASIDSDRIFGRFELAERPALVAAVSGGSDSLGLLFLLKDHLGRRAPATQIVAVTIDQGLRAEAAGEARAVAALCHAQGITHRTLRWTTAKPATGLPAAAREARYRLLAEAAATEGTDLVLTGHTLDDLIETVDMRRARGAKGPGDGRGLAGMAPATLYDGRSWLLRPLLGTERAALRAWLTERAIGWIDDPTNVDSKYERARLRAATAIGQDTQSARSRIAAAASERAALGEAAAALIRTHAKLAAPGLVALNPAFAECLHGEAAVYALRMMLAAIGGMEQLPDARSGAALFPRIAQESFRSTLSRVVIDATARAIFLRREGRGLPGPSRQPSGGIWDGRFRIGNLPEGTTLAPAGIAAAAAIMDASSVVASDIAPGLVRSAVATEPALWRDGLCQGLAAESGMARRIIAPWARFLPSFDLAPARAAAELVGADIAPEPPFAGHKERKG